MIPYSRKFSQVQNFVESPLRASEEITAVLIFAVPAHTGRRGAIDIALAAIFVVFIFTKANLFAKITKFCTTQKFPTIRYTRVIIRVNISKAAHPNHDNVHEQVVHTNGSRSE